MADELGIRIKAEVVADPSQLSHLKDAVESKLNQNRPKVEADIELNAEGANLHIKSVETINKGVRTVTESYKTMGVEAGKVAEIIYRISKELDDQGNVINKKVLDRVFDFQKPITELQKFEDMAQRVQWYIQRLGKDTPLNIRQELSKMASKIVPDGLGEWKQRFSELQSEIAKVRANFLTFGETTKQMEYLDNSIQKAAVSIKDFKIEPAYQEALTSKLKTYADELEELKPKQQAAIDQILAAQKLLDDSIKSGADDDVLKGYRTSLNELKQNYITTFSVLDELTINVENFNKTVSTIGKDIQLDKKIQTSIADINAEILKLSDTKAIDYFKGKLNDLLSGIDMDNLTGASLNSVESFLNKIKAFSAQATEVDNLETALAKVNAQIEDLDKSDFPIDKLDQFKRRIEEIRTSNMGSAGMTSAFKELSADISDAAKQAADLDVIKSAFEKVTAQINEMARANFPIGKLEEFQQRLDAIDDTKLNKAAQKEALQKLSSDIKEAVKNAAELDSLNQQFEKVSANLNKVKGDANAVSELAKKLNDLKKIQDTHTEIQLLTEELHRLKFDGRPAEEIQLFQEEINKLQNSIPPIKNTSEELSKLNQEITILGQNTGLQNQITNNQNAIEKMLRQFSNLDLKEQLRLEFENILTDPALQLGTLSEKLVEFKAKVRTELDATEEGRRLQTAIKQIENAFETLNIPSDKLAEFRQRLNDILNADYDALAATRAINDLKQEMKFAVDNGGILINSLKRMATQFISLTAIVSAFRSAFKEMREIDTQLTELSKVSDVTREQFQQVSIAATEAASRWGRTAAEYLKGMTDFARAGKENYQALAEVSVMAQSAGDITAELANQYLIASDAAFQMRGSAESLIALLDGQNQITNRNAVSMQNMADATKVYANTAAIAGETTQTMSALIATAVSATQRTGSEIGTALRTFLKRSFSMNPCCSRGV